MAGTICLYRLDTTGQTESNAPEKIEFDGNASAPDSRSHIENYNVTMTLVTQENPVPDTNNPSGLQDTGLAVVQYEIVGFFNSTSSTAGAIALFRDWLREEKTNTSLPFGRFGIRNDRRAEFDVVSSATKGLILEHFEITEEYEYIGRTEFTARLRYNGAISGLG